MTKTIKWKASIYSNGIWLDYWKQPNKMIGNYLVWLTLEQYEKFLLWANRKNFHIETIETNHRIKWDIGEVIGYSQD